MRKPVFYLPALLFLFSGTTLLSQGYQALHGSGYTGSTAVFNNPASLVHSVYKWELTLLSAQVKTSTNAFYLQNTNGSRSLVIGDGYRSRFAHGNADISLFNFMYKTGNNQAFAVNFRLRNYAHARTLPFNYIDSTATSFNNFLIANRTTPFIEGFATTAGWAEADLSYSRVLSQTTNSRLSGGITLQIMKNISGGFAKLNKLSFLELKNGTDTAYAFTNGSGSFAYAESLAADGVKDALKKSPLSLGLSLGLEYLVYDEDNTEKDNLSYDWKIGVSLLDLGAHRYKASPNSRQFSGPKQTITDADADRKFSGVTDAQGFADTVSSLFNDASAINNSFSVSQPTRLVLNVDRNLGNHFYLNGELSLNFYATSSYQKLRTRELNLLTITPRWETMGFGAYLPVQYNTQGQLWIGAAMKLGPLTLGLHNLGLLLKKQTSVSGGGYLLLSVHPFSRQHQERNFDCL
ncbi:hypothetical protein [Sediminibacterium soli]|uniref:hypothetical protein n=1 Tax=Sediminibacterium soli TaxID=2698829 RepID=UPI001379AE4B|nr:hypothetical protein [Sediminibacterium soli]NCI47245.1 hypothetical protein [Sediminibacterium soli]